MITQTLKEKLDLLENKRKELKELIAELKKKEKEKCGAIKKKYWQKIYPLTAELNELDFNLCKIVMQKEGDLCGK